MSSFILKNGKFYADTEKFFCLADQHDFLLTEEIRAIRNAFPLLKETFDLLLLKFRILNQPIPDFLLADGRELKRQMERFLVKNKLFKTAIVDLSFFQNERGQTDYFISAKGTGATSFEINTHGLMVAVFDKMEKAISGLSSLSLGSECIWNIAAKHLRSSMVDDFLIVNSEQKIIEGIRKKLLLVTGFRLLGVSPEAGACLDVISPLIPGIAAKAGLTYSECGGFTEKQLLQADELFFLDALNGVQWILGIGEKRYYHDKARIFSEELNHTLVC